MSERTLKGLIHAGLAVMAVIECFGASRPRKFLLGTAAGWHAHGAFYHFLIEGRE